MGKMLAVLAGIGVVLCALPSGCGSQVSTTTQPPQWVVMRGDSVELRLPDTFKGGASADSAAVAGLLEIAELLDEPALRDELRDWLATVNDDERYDTRLVAWAAVDDGKDFAQVRVTRDSLQYFTSFTDGDASPSALASDLMTGPYGNWEVERITEDEAVLTVHYDETDQAGWRPELVVLRPYGEWVYTISYSCLEEYWADFYEIFASSSESIVIW